MIVPLLLIVSANLAALEVITVPVDHPSARAFPVPLQTDGHAAVAVLDGYRLALYAPNKPRPSHTFTLPENTSALDITDIDGDGNSELIVVAGDRFLHYTLGISENPVQLFTAANVYQRHTGLPSARVLTTTLKDEPVIAVPTNGGIELRRHSGELIETQNLEPADQKSSGLSTWSRPTANGVLHRVVHATPYLYAQLPEPAAPAQTIQPQPRAIPLSRVTNGHKLDPRFWGWLPLQNDGQADARILYAAHKNGRDTLVRYRWPPERGEPAPLLSDALRFPGSLVVHPEEWPDFNGDGYTDLILWRAPSPGHSVDALTRTISTGTWPVTFTIHFYNPQTKRHDARPAMRFDTNVPVGWFIEPNGGIPLRQWLFCDLDGDGRDDFACATSERAFTIWIMRNERPQNHSTYKRIFPSSIDSIQFKAALQPASTTTTIGLRTENAIHILSIRP